MPPVKVAVIVVLAFSVATQVNAPVDTQAPAGVQLTKLAPELGTAVSTTLEPGANEVPVGDCVIVPAPTTLVVSVTFVAKFAVML